MAIASATTVKRHLERTARPHDHAGKDVAPETVVPNQNSADAAATATPDRPS